jgi:hypothetical protein
MDSRTLIVVLVAASACNVINRDLLGASDSGAGTDAATPPRDSTGGGDSPVTPPSDMLMVDYEFEDGTGAMATDSARGLNGLLSNPAMWTANGRNGKGIAMVAAVPANQYVSLPDGILSTTDDFTISVWVKLSSNPIWARIYDIGNGLPDPQNRFMYLTLNGFAPGTTTADGVHADSYGGMASNESVVATYTFVPTNVWKHIAVTGSGGQRKLYIDGFPAATLDNGPAIAPREMEPISPQSWLGKSRFDSDSGFSGSMDEFRIYSRVLTASEIQDLAWPKLDYSYWRFDDSSGTAAKDSSDHHLATSLANGAAWTTGRLGGAIGFGGGSAGENGPHVVIAGNPLAACTNAFTISMWIRINMDVPNSRVFDFGTAGTHDIYLAPNDGTGMHFGMKSPAGTFDLVTSAPPIQADSTWHHVAVTMDAGNTVVLFVDGMPVKTQPSPSVRPADFANLAEAYLARSRGQDPYFNGAIDELRIGCRAFTPDEIKNLSRP